MTNLYSIALQLEKHPQQMAQQHDERTARRNGGYWTP